MFCLTEKWHPPKTSFHKDTALISHSKSLHAVPTEYETGEVVGPHLRKAKRTFPSGADGPMAFLAWVDLKQLHFTEGPTEHEKEWEGGQARGFSLESWRWFRPCVPLSYSHHPEQPTFSWCWHSLQVGTALFLSRGLGHSPNERGQLTVPESSSGLATEGSRPLLTSSGFIMMRGPRAAALQNVLWWRTFPHLRAKLSVHRCGGWLRMATGHSPGFLVFRTYLSPEAWTSSNLP